MDGQRPAPGHKSPSKTILFPFLTASLLAVATNCLPAHAQAMGKVVVDGTPAVAEVSEAAAPAALGAAPGRTVAVSSALPQTGGDRDGVTPAADRSIDVPALRASLAPVSPSAVSGPRLQSPGGLSMPALPAVLSAADSTPAAATLAVHTPAAPEKSAAAVPQNFAPVNPAPSTTPTPAPAVVPAPPAPKPPANDSIESKPINVRIQPPAAPASQPAAAASASAAPAKSTSSGFFAGAGNFAQVGAALAIVIGLIFVGKGLAKKFVPGARASAGKGVIEILARHPLAKNQSIVLVRIGSQIVALNQGKEASESVLVISDQAEVARIIGQIEGQSPKSIQAGFTNLLANARMDLERGEDLTDTEQDPDLRTISPENLDEQLEEMAAAKRQLMELRQHVRSVRDSLPRA
jgi:flagellar biogenesis protein FliO